MSAPALRKVVALSGGVGGARLLHGLSRVLEPDALTCVVNTGDDFEHWGLSISPDIDTVVYTLSDLAHEERGWGLAEESFHALGMMKRYGAPDWFALGDRDLAMHLVRTEALRRGETLSAVTHRLASSLGIGCRILPMTDPPCRTWIDTDEHGALLFQDWFVRHRTGPRVKAVRWDASPPPAPGVLEAIRAADLVVIGPSNPYVSIDPILALAGVREAVLARPVVAVSPIVHGQAVKGPLARMIGDLAGLAPGPEAIARHYGKFDGVHGLRGIVVETGDERDVTTARALPTSTLMKTRADSSRLAREVLTFARELI
jgi:LPPG:FO 2-phospho-L-lactate transferase